MMYNKNIQIQITSCHAGQHCITIHKGLSSMPSTEPDITLSALS